MSLQLTDNLWELKLDSTLDATQEQHLIGSFTNPFVVTYVVSDNVLPAWQQAGSIGQAINFDNNFAYGEVKQITLNNYLLLQFPLLSGDTYNLYYFPLDRLVEAKIKVWEYKGDTKDVSVANLVNTLESVELPKVEKQLEKVIANNQYNNCDNIEYIEDESYPYFFNL